MSASVPRREGKGSGLCDPTSIGEKNEEFFIRVRKPLPSRRAGKHKRKSPKKTISANDGLDHICINEIIKLLIVQNIYLPTPFNGLRNVEKEGIAEMAEQSEIDTKRTESEAARCDIQLH